MTEKANSTFYMVKRDKADDSKDIWINPFQVRYLEPYRDADDRPRVKVHFASDHYVDVAGTAQVVISMLKLDV